jgi:uncharacterized protein (TIGR02246 family)
MTDDERAIRNLVDTWMAASKAGDLKTVLGLIADDALFTVVGQEPFGKEAFAAASAAQTDIDIQGTNDIEEIKVLGDWAYMRNRLAVTVTPKGGKPVRRSGYTLTVLRKQPASNWVLVRDANLMTTAE